MPKEIKYELLLIKRLRERGFSDEQIEAIINTLKMAQTAQQKADIARELARRLYQSDTANLNHDDLVAAVSAIDAAMDVLPPALGQALSVKQNLIAALPEPFKSNSTAQQKALVLMLWVMKETGLL